MSEISIESLRNLREQALNLNKTIVGDLKPFMCSDGTFRRLPDRRKKDDIDEATTCTCLMALSLSDALDKMYEHGGSTSAETAFINILKSKWASSGLDEDNAFTTTLVLRTYGFLKEKKILCQDSTTYKHEPPKSPKSHDPSRYAGKNIVEIANIISSRIPDTLKINRYDPTAAVAYWFIEGIFRAEIQLKNKALQSLCEFAQKEFEHHYSCVSSRHDALMDPVSMAMSACLVARLYRYAYSANNNNLLNILQSKIALNKSITLLLEFQKSSGILPKFFPLFHYRDSGSNYCFTYELLEAVLHEFGNAEIIDNPSVFAALEKAVNWCKSNRLDYYYKGERYQGWNSEGEIKSLKAREPESWATAAVHMFLWLLSEKLSEMIQNIVLDEYKATHYNYDISSKQWERLLDTIVDLSGDSRTIKEVIEKQIIMRVSSLDKALLRQESLKERDIRHSVLLFGPPGTSKTYLVRAFAQKIGWPLVEINPYHFLKRGLDNIHIEVDKVFKDLSDLTKAVVLFDEMDALARSREGGDTIPFDLTSLFLTTSMLPRLSELHDKGQLIYFMVTNFFERVDDAIKRPGRFDMLLCVSPPTWNVKLQNLKVFIRDKSEKTIKEAKGILEKSIDDNQRKILDRFTFMEMKAFFEHFESEDGIIPSLKKNKGKMHLLIQDWEERLILKASEDCNSSFKRWEHDKNRSRLQ
jgi:hypothetical protein